MKLKEKVKTASLASVQYINYMKDILIGAATNRQVLVYDSVTGKWKNDFLNAEDLGDATISTPAEHDCLIWNTTAWVNSAPNLEYLKDTTLPSPAHNTIIYYNSVLGKWTKLVDPVDGRFLSCVGGELTWVVPSGANYLENFSGNLVGEVSVNQEAKIAEELSDGMTTEISVVVS